MNLKRDDVMNERRINKTKQREREIIKTAMRLFGEKGYEQTSMRDIAKNMGVSLGLCYRYFDSKQILFNNAIELYIEDCCQQYLTVLHNPGIKIKDKINLLFSSIGLDHSGMEYHEFFHRIENEELHEQLSMRLCKFMYPQLLEEVQKAIENGEIKIEHPEVLISFITYGQIGLLSKSDIDHQKVIKLIHEYIVKLMEL